MSYLASRTLTLTMHEVSLYVPKAYFSHRSFDGLVFCLFVYDVHFFVVLGNEPKALSMLSMCSTLSYSSSSL